MKVLVTGGTGFVGQRVVEKLLDHGHEVVISTRSVPRAILTCGPRCQYVLWGDTKSPAPAEAFTGVDAIIHLMGENIGEKRWDEEQKKKIYDSRITGTRMLLEGMRDLSEKPKVLVSASAIGIYGARGDENLHEDASKGEDFLAKVCKNWEEEALKARDQGLRVVLLRTGVVLGKDGGALKKMLPIFRLGLGGKLGSGEQFMSWIHVDDLAEMYVRAVEDESLFGAFNAVAPHPVTNAEFTRELGRVLHRPTILPAPAFALKTALGEMSTIVLDGQKVIPKKFEESNFQYRMSSLPEALRESTH